MISIDFLCQGWGGLDFSNDRGEMAPLVWMVAWGSQMMWTLSCPKSDDVIHISEGQHTHTLKRSEMSNKQKSVLILTALRLVVLGGDRQADDIESSHAIHQQHPQYLQKGVTVLLIMLLASQYLIYLSSIPKRRPQHGTRHHRWPLFQGSSGGPETRRHRYYGYYGMI